MLEKLRKAKAMKALQEDERSKRPNLPAKVQNRLANKAMDATAMGTGAVIGGVLGAGVFSPLTASIGASTGKMLSDGTQWLFGDKKTPDQRKMETALVALNGGQI